MGSSNTLGIVNDAKPFAELEKIRIVCGPESARELGVDEGYVIDPDEEPELYARHQAFAKGEAA
jgi:hypothetical protein